MVTRFCLAVHCHQPVGNFPWVFKEAFDSAYRPFLETLKRHLDVRLVFHYSGVLLDWLKAEHPDFLKSMKALVNRGQVEFLGGGYYEPILTMIPPQDAVGQLKKMNRVLCQLGLERGKGSQGAWLTERVWEPQLPCLLSQAGIRYTVVDDHHLAKAGVEEEKRFGYYLTEDRQFPLALFPSLKLLRYLVPFKPVGEVIEALRQFRSEEPRVVVLADDGEKFGLWPGTNTWVYREGWLESFFQALEDNRSWLRMLTFREALETLPPLGKVFVPDASYEEMEAWSGGFFRNYLAKYPEANSMHKKMLWISDRLKKPAADVRTRRLIQQARTDLYRAQDNDAYWHGIFGGIYLRHLRRSVWQHLLRAERILDEMEEVRGKGKGWLKADELDFDADQRKEISLRSSELTLLVDPNQGGHLVELSDKEFGVNLLDTLTRRPEAYHGRLRLGSLVHAAERQEGSLIPPGPMSIHERSEESQGEWADLIMTDPYRRASLLDHLLPLKADVRSFSTGNFQELGDFLGGAYEGKVQRGRRFVEANLLRQGRARIDGTDHPLRIRKGLCLFPEGRRLKILYTLTSGSFHRLNFLFGSEFNLALKDAHVNRVGQASGIRRFSLNDPACPLRISWEFSQRTQLWYFPVEAISDSERGMERTFQGACLIFLWPVDLKPKGSFRVSGELKLEATRAHP